MCNSHCPERKYNDCEGKSFSCKSTEQNSSNECCSSVECKAGEGADNEQPKLRYSICRQQFAIAISVLSIFYNGAEGIVSVVFGEENGSYSLIFFGIQSFVEVVSACLVIWRFIKIAKPGEEQNKTISDELLNKERKATIGIGILFGILTIGTWATPIKNSIYTCYWKSLGPLIQILMGYMTPQNANAMMITQCVANNMWEQAQNYITIRNKLIMLVFHLISTTNVKVSVVEIAWSPCLESSK
jgi:hypothetical protein